MLSADFHDFEDSYVLFTLSKFSYSYKQQQVAPNKVYSIDNGLSYINSISFSKFSQAGLGMAVGKAKNKEIFINKKTFLFSSIKAERFK